MKNQITITKEALDKVKQSRNDGDKGKYIEEIVEMFFKEKNTEYVKLASDKVKMQKYLGDFLIMFKNNPIFVDVKSSHTFRKTNTDKLALDYLYFRKNSYCKIPYIQKNSADNLGWLHYTQANWIIAFNDTTNKLYIITDFNKMRDNLVDDINTYYNSLKDNSYTWYVRDYNNNINKYIEGSVKRDSGKDSLIVNLNLTKESIKYYGGELHIIDVIIEQDTINLDNEKNTPTVQSRVFSKRI